MNQTDYDFVVVGGGPSGATAAHDLVRQGWRVLLPDRHAGTKPFGGAVPPPPLQAFDIPYPLPVATVPGARLNSPVLHNVALREYPSYL